MHKYLDWCNPLNSTEVYDPEADTWTVLADLKAGRGDKACGTLNDRVFAIGELCSCVHPCQNAFASCQT